MTALHNTMITCDYKKECFYFEVLMEYLERFFCLGHSDDNKLVFTLSFQCLCICFLTHTYEGLIKT